MLMLWVTKAMDDGILLTGEILRQKWTTFADRLHIPADERIKLSNGWLDKFKAHLGLYEIRRHGEAASAKPADIADERRRVCAMLLALGYKPEDIYNADETGLFWR
jgi:hypothetical protein